MKLPLSFIVLAIAGIVAPAATAEQQGVAMERGQKARLGPTAPLMVADATAAQGSSAPRQVDRVIGVCHLSENPFDPTSAVNSMSVADEAVWYLENIDHSKVRGQPSVSILQTPAHGNLLDGGNGNYAYLPEKGYLGNDRATLLIEVGGKKVRMEYFFRVLQQVPDQEGVDAYADNCPKKVRVWKISSTTDTSGNAILAAVDYQSLAANANEK